MTVRNKISLIVYRIHEKGVEVLIPKATPPLENWMLYQGVPIQADQIEQLPGLIEVNTIQDDGSEIRTIAIEADWHDIPRIRSLIKNDVYYMKDKISTLVPELDQGAYVAVKKLVKKLMPNEYAVLKEIKDIICDRNLLINI